MPEALTSRPAKVMTRTEYVRALVALDAYRHEAYGAPRAMSSIDTGASVPDVGQGSIFAKALRLGWLQPINGRFAGDRSITADEASLGATGVVGLGSSVRTLARRIKKEIPGSGKHLVYRSAQIHARTLGMRYNHLAGRERLEVGPGEGMRVAHVAYMLRVAATERAPRSRFAVHRSLVLPRLGANQRRILATGIRLIGQPYVWGGESEGRQPEGHGGFDCSGFVWRTVITSGVPATERVAVSSRTSMGMSDIGRRKRLGLRKLRPGDIIFFGSKGRRSDPSENFHTGVWMGNGWFMHSSGSNDGVTISRMEGYWSSTFSWGRRVLKTS